MAGKFSGTIGLECGHKWPGVTDTRADAEEFMAACIATGDTMVCGECGQPKRITGPLVEV